MPVFCAVCLDAAAVRERLQRLLHRDGFDTLGDFHDMSNANIQV